MYRTDAKHAATLAETSRCAERADRLCELNVIEQVGTCARPSIVRDAWDRNQPLKIHGWI